MKFPETKYLIVRDGKIFRTISISPSETPFADFYGAFSHTFEEGDEIYVRCDTRDYSPWHETEDD